MQDMRPLANSRNLKSWRAWEGEAYRRSGFNAVLLASPMLTVLFVLAFTAYGRAPGHIEAVVIIGFGLYLATVLGLMGFAVLRLQAWRRANPWIPPSQTAIGSRLRTGRSGQGAA
jgi:hypothetical protein